MKIAYIIPSLAATGPMIMVKALVDEMMKHGHQCVVFYFDDKVAQLDMPARRITNYRPIDFRKFDVVHAHGIRPNLYVSVYKPWRRVKTKFVTTVHSYIFTEFRYCFGRFLGALFGLVFIASTWRMDKVVVLSKDAKRYFSRSIPSSKMDVIYNGLSELKGKMTVEEETMIEKFKAGRVMIGICSSLVLIKGVDILLRALAVLPQQYCLLVIGDGDQEDRLKSLCKQLGIEGRVMFAGYRPDAYRYLPAIDIYVQTSWSEGFCLALTEAAFYGKKIVCSDIPSMREKFADSEITYYDTHAVDSLVSGILAAEKDDSKGRKAQQKAKTLFTSSRMYEQYLRLYGSSDITSDNRRSSV